MKNSDAVFITILLLSFYALIFTMGLESLILTLILFIFMTISIIGAIFINPRMNDTILNDPLIEESNEKLPNDSRSIVKSKRYFQVDAWKTLMIALVIMDHTFTHTFLHDYGSSYWERISIPILMIVMGFNMGKSFDKQGLRTLKEMYSFSYIENKMKRYVVPFLILYLAHTVLFIFESADFFETNDVVYYENFQNIFIGYTPFYGPGMWFLPVLMSTILIFPLLYWCYKRNSVLTIFGTFVIEISWYFIKAGLYGYFAWDNPARVMTSYFSCHVFALFSAVGMGLWFSTDHDLLSPRNFFIWPIGLLSLIYIIMYQEYGNWYFLTGDYNLGFFPYSGFLFLIGMNFFPMNPKGKLSDIIRRISKSTYHILLTQIFYFSIVYQFFLTMFDPIDPTPDMFDGSPLNYLWFYPLNLLITFSIGMVWNKLENQFYQRAKENTTASSIYKIAIVLALIYFIVRIILIVILFIKY
ncbi:hypothetical protein NEF87_004440 [Candidatus Lokiarchaeum ossiferum]|uniref:Acyltransferase 3 domain-containing protein n=1 Tax=Candidatus Lokiarchaeum ossiferum TaxID=2951803 RepID=A0ABY6HXL6_9ARCH|nr:hypothetical protein NEF87_004440 [Candidatus Lokiarchaeum sp. B-35]